MNQYATYIAATFAAGVVLFLPTGFAAADPTLAIANVNLRQGPGLQYGVIATIPGGSTVDVINCQGDWCNVQWGGRGGYTVARNLDLGGGPGSGVAPPPGPRVAPPPGPVVVAPPLPTVVVDPYPYPYYWGPDYYWGPRRYGWRRW